MADGTARKQRGKPFAAGKSGNPTGRKAGTRNKATIAIEQLLEGEARAIGRKCIELAKAGDTVALRLAMERLVPLRKGRPVNFDLPQIVTAADVTKALGAVLSATASGHMTPDEASTIASVVDVKRRAIELVELESRIANLENAARGASK